MDTQPINPRSSPPRPLSRSTPPFGILVRAACYGSKKLGERGPLVRRQCSLGLGRGRSGDESNGGVLKVTRATAIELIAEAPAALSFFSWAVLPQIWICLWASDPFVCFRVGSFWFCVAGSSSCPLWFVRRYFVFFSLTPAWRGKQKNRLWVSKQN